MTAWIIVEDEKDIYHVLTAFFKMWGIDGVGFNNSDDALDWIEAVDEADELPPLPELALIDIRLPGATNGVGISARLRQSERLKGIAIALTTAFYLSPEEEARFLHESGADVIIYKPLPDSDLLRAQLMRLVRARRSD